MRKYFIIVTILITAVSFAAIRAMTYSFDAADNGQRLVCIGQFGWETEKEPVEEENVIIPSPLDDVYEEYNKLQKQIGLDLTAHQGESATRYTYVVLNHPDKEGREVRANILVSDGKMIAGDIMVVALDGYMHAMNKKR